MKKGYGYLRYSFISILLLCALSLIFSCGRVNDETVDTTTTYPTDTETVFTVGSISLKASDTYIKSDSSDSTTITATVLDTHRAVIEGVSVQFSAQSGLLSDSEVITDDNGEAQITFKSGTADQTNRTDQITVTAGGITEQILINIIGTTVTLLSNKTTTLQVDGVSDTLTITVKDASLNGIDNAPVNVRIDTVNSTGTVSFESATGITDVNGVLNNIYTENGEVDITVKGTAEGTVTVIAESMNALATKTYTVKPALADVFYINDPTQNPYDLKTGTDLSISVNAPSQSRVRFVTSLGSWDGGPDMSVIKAVLAGSASATLRSSNAGVAIVQVMDPNDSSMTDSLRVLISVPPEEASQIALLASSAVVAPSTDVVSNSITLTARVRNISEDPVGDAPVGFSIVDSTGGGEFVMPTYVCTDSYGIASATFTSGSLSSGNEGVKVMAMVIGTAIEDNISIVIGGLAGSIMIGRSTKILSNESNTAYHLPMSVIVADTSGAAMHGVQVSLNLWPAQYRAGWIAEDPNSWGVYDNEDINKNLILDPGEDLNEDGQLTPPNSAAGTVPSILITDEYGVATFDLVYLKASAIWIKAQITATTFVYGTETQSTYSFWLPYDKKDEESLPSSPYEPPL